MCRTSNFLIKRGDKVGLEPLTSNCYAQLHSFRLGCAIKRYLGVMPEFWNEITRRPGARNPRYFSAPQFAYTEPKKPETCFFFVVRGSGGRQQLLFFQKKNVEFCIEEHVLSKKYIQMCFLRQNFHLFQ